MPRSHSNSRQTIGMCRTPAECAGVMKTLSDPNRIRIVRALIAGPANVGEISARAGLNVHRVSHHLGRMRQSGLVTRTRHGRQIVYRIAAAIDTANGLDLGCCQVQFRPL